MVAFLLPLALSPMGATSVVVFLQPLVAFLLPGPMVAFLLPLALSPIGATSAVAKTLPLNPNKEITLFPSNCAHRVDASSFLSLKTFFGCTAIASAVVIIEGQHLPVF